VARLFLLIAEYTLASVHPTMIFDKFSKSPSTLILAAYDYSLSRSGVNLASNEISSEVSVDCRVENGALDLIIFRF
jgi:hypothetical protein